MPMQNIVDSCRVWESPSEAGVRRHDGSGRNSLGRARGHDDDMIPVDGPLVVVNTG